MDVLLLESERGSAHEVIDALHDAGHVVHRCHEAGLPAFPCNGILSGTCPLERGSIDVAVTVRPHVRPAPTPLEDGVACAIRRHVPVVLVGAGALNPYERFGVVEVAEAGDVANGCEVAVGRRRREIAVVALDAAQQLCDAFHHDATGMTVDVDMGRDGTVVEVTTPNGPRRLDTAISSALGFELQRRLPWAKNLRARMVGADRID